MLRRLQFGVFPILVLVACQENPVPSEDSPTSPVQLSSSQISSPAIADIIVNTTSDVADLGYGADLGNLPGPDGLISLREAIIAANNSPGPQVIGFNIPVDDEGFDGVVFTIRPLDSSLPGLLDDGTTIDGTTQALYSGDTNPSGPEIVLDGTEAGVDQSGISLGRSNNHVIRGLVVHSFSFNGISFYFGNRSRIVGCYIGTDETGSLALGNGAQGIAGEGSQNVIGGPDPSDRNLISGNGTIYGVSELQIDQDNTVVEGNLIGTDKTGTVALGSTTGIVISDVAGVPAAGTDNVIRNNLISGTVTAVAVDGPTASGNRIEQNLIGSDITGGNPLPNDDGVVLGSHDNVVEDNLIAFNLGNAVTVTSDATRNRVSRNLMLSNGGLGIDLGRDGVTANDPGDEDAGANDLLNFPVLTEALATAGRLVVRATIDTPDPQTVTIEFFANPVPAPGGDLSGHGEGAVFLGTARPNPEGRITAVLPTVAPGTLITATATDAEGNTSEFALNVEARSPIRGQP